MSFGRDVEMLEWANGQAVGLWVKETLSLERERSGGVSVSICQGIMAMAGRCKVESSCGCRDAS